MTSDARIVREVLAGRPRRFGALVDRYQNLVNGAILASLGRVEEREDLAQTVFLKAFEGLGVLGEPEKFGFWLRRIAENEATTYLRRRATASPGGEG